MLAGCFLVTCAAFGDVWNLTGCLAVVYLTAEGEAHRRQLPRSIKQTGTSFLHLFMFNPAYGLVRVNDVPFNWIGVCRFCAAHIEMWRVTVNCVSLASASVIWLQRMFRSIDWVSILCCFELVGIWLSLSWCHVLGKRRGYNAWYGRSVMPCVCLLKGCLKVL